MTGGRGRVESGVICGSAVCLAPELDAGTGPLVARAVREHAEGEPGPYRQERRRLRLDRRERTVADAGLHRDGLEPARADRPNLTTRGAFGRALGPETQRRLAHGERVLGAIDLDRHVRGH